MDSLVVLQLGQCGNQSGLALFDEWYRELSDAPEPLAGVLRHRFFREGRTRGRRPADSAASPAAPAAPASRTDPRGAREFVSPPGARLEAETDARPVLYARAVLVDTEPKVVRRCLAHRGLTEREARDLRRLSTKPVPVDVPETSSRVSRGEDAPRAASSGRGVTRSLTSGRSLSRPRGAAPGASGRRREVVEPPPVLSVPPEAEALSGRQPGWRFDPRRVFCREGGAANNWAFGSQIYGPSCREEILRLIQSVRGTAGRVHPLVLGPQSRPSDATRRPTSPFRRLDRRKRGSARTGAPAPSSSCRVLLEERGPVSGHTWPVYWMPSSPRFRASTFWSGPIGLEKSSSSTSTRP